MNIEDQKSTIADAYNRHRRINAINHREYQATLFGIASNSLTTDECRVLASVKQSLRPLVLLLSPEYHLKA